MLSTKDVAVIYETLLTSPGMSENVKISLQIPRKNILLVTNIIQLGISVKDTEQGALVQVVGKEAIGELQGLIADLLQKSGLTEVYNKINALQGK